MRVVEKILYRIKDDDTVSVLIADDGPVAKLVKAYNRLALDAGGSTRPGLYALVGDSYGSDIKRYINYLPATDQLRLLDSYLYTFPDTEGDEPIVVVPPPVETELVKDERRQRHWMMKAGITFLLVSLFTLLGAVIAIMAHNKQAPDSVLIKTVMDTATEVIKLLFSTK